MTIREMIQEGVLVDDGVEPASPFWANLDGLPAMVKALAEARQDAAHDEELVKVTEALIKQTDAFAAWQLAQTTLFASREKVAALDAAVRKAAVDDFTKNGEKAVYAGVKIKMFTKAAYDPAQMRDWLLDHQSYRALLTVDDKKVTALAAKGLLLDAPVVVTKEPRATIDSDLSGYLGH